MILDLGRARLPLAALFAGALGIAFSPIFVRLSELGPSATAFHRVFLALPILWLWMAAEAHGTRRCPSRRELWWLVMAGVFFAADLGVWHWSIRFTSVANATLLANLAPVFVALAAWSLFDEHITPLFVGGLALAVVGVALMVGADVGGGERLLGDGLGILAAMFYAGYILTVSRLRAALTTMTIMAYSSAIAAIVLLPLALASGEGLIAATAFGWAMLVGIALVSQVAGQSLIAYALAHLPAPFSSVGLLVQPLAAALLAWVILAEPLGALQALGGAVAIAGIVLAHRGSDVTGRGAPAPARRP